MSDPSTYYAKFKLVLERYDPVIANSFDDMSQKRSPRAVFIWLEDLRLKGLLPKELEEPLTDFYGLYC